MRANEFITEDTSEKPIKLLQLAKLIWQDCQPYLQLNNYTGRLYRGVNYHIFADLRTNPLVSVRKDRHPRDTAMFVHTLVDNYFYEKFGIKFRSTSIFTSGKYKFTSQFGGSVVVFPKGNFDYCWSPKVIDLTYNLINDTPLDFVTETDEVKEEILSALDDANYVCNVGAEDFTRAMRSGKEIMIHCDSFYAVDSQSYTTLMKYIRALRDDAITNSASTNTLETF